MPTLLAAKGQERAVPASLVTGWVLGTHHDQKYDNKTDHFAVSSMVTLPITSTLCIVGKAQVHSREVLQVAK